MELTPRQRRSLEAICETFCPTADGLPSATQLGVPDAVLQLAGRDPRSAARKSSSSSWRCGTRRQSPPSAAAGCTASARSRASSASRCC